jgi:hypothetical protein
LDLNIYAAGFCEDNGEEILYEYAKLISRSAYGSLEREQELPQECVFCGSRTDLTTDHLIPRNKGGGDSSDNLVLSCRLCNISRVDKGIFEWLGLEKKDSLHRLVAGKYLKQLLKLHEIVGTLEISKKELNQLCQNCLLPKVCEQWAKVNQLTCFCLESILQRK